MGWKIWVLFSREVLSSLFQSVESSCFVRRVIIEVENERVYVEMLRRCCREREAFIIKRLG
jgi:hypothetical protein